jgi:hypothetical protein
MMNGRAVRSYAIFQSRKGLRALCAAVLSTLATCQAKNDRASTVGGRMPRSTSPQESMVQTALDSGWTTNVWNGRIGAAIPPLVAHTAYSSQWQINERVRPGWLNIYVLRADITAEFTRLPPLMQQVAGNCAYAGAPGIVVCDEAFLATFLTDIGLETYVSQWPDAKGRLSVYRSAFLSWVLGHEIGHAVLQHPPSHFGRDAFTTMVANASLSQRRELQADSFFVSRLYSNETRALDVVRLTIDLLNIEIRAKVGDVGVAGVGIIYDYNDKKVVTYATEGEHPEFVVREVRLLDLVGTDGPPTLRGVAAMVRPFISHMREAPTP